MEEPMDISALSDQEKLLWLINRVGHMEDLVGGISDVLMLFIGLSEWNDETLQCMRQALTEGAMRQPPGSLRSQPYWTALGLLQAVSPDAPGE